MQSLEALLNLFVVLAFIAAAIVHRRRDRQRRHPGEPGRSADASAAANGTPAAATGDADVPVVTRELAQALLADADRWGTRGHPPAPAPHATSAPRTAPPAHRPTPRHGLPFQDRRALRQTIAAMTVLGPCRALEPYGGPARPGSNPDH